MRVVETKIYTIEEHPNPVLCYDWIRDNMHDLNQDSVDDIINSIKALTSAIGGTNSFSISQVPCRGEYISFKDYDKLALQEIHEQDMNLTGVWSDYIVTRAVQKNNPSQILKDLHEETSYIYSDEGLYEHCVINQCEFDENGKLI